MVINSGREAGWISWVSQQTGSLGLGVLRSCILPGITGPKREAGGAAPRYSRVVEHTPAAVGVARAKALAAALILPTGLHRDSGELGWDRKTAVRALQNTQYFTRKRSYSVRHSM